MKILLVSRNINKNGGIPRYTTELAERFKDKHDIHVLTSNYDYKISGIMVHKKPIIREPFWLQILTNAYYNTKYIKKLDKKHNFDIVHTQGSGAFTCDIVTAHSCHRAALKKVNGFDKEELPFYKYLIHKIYRFLKPTNRVVLPIEKRVFENGSKKIISVARGVKREIVKSYSISAKKIEVIPNGVDLKEFDISRRKGKELRKKYDIRKGELVLFFCAHEFRRKGLRVIIESLPLIESDVKLLVAGKDNPMPYKKIASKLGVIDQIIFAGNIKENINHYYSASDIFVFPTKYEAFSFATLEAIASGLPLVVTEGNGTEEIVREGENGFFVEREKKDVAEKINRIIENEELRKKMEENAKETAREYSWDKIAKKTEELYKKVKNEKS